MAKTDTAAAAPQPEYDFVVARDVMVAMRDGVKLTTDIYRPARNGMAEAGKFPVRFWKVDEPFWSTKRESALRAHRFPSRSVISDAARFGVTFRSLLNGMIAPA